MVKNLQGLLRRQDAIIATLEALQARVNSLTSSTAQAMSTAGMHSIGSQKNRRDEMVMLPKVNLL